MEPDFVANYNSRNLQIQLIKTGSLSEEGAYNQDLTPSAIISWEWGRQSWKGCMKEVLSHPHVTPVSRNCLLCLQRFWRSYQSRKQGEPAPDPLVLGKAAIVLQTHWRGFVERRRFLQMQFAAHLIQSCWREYAKRRHDAATSIQAAWRGHRAKQSYTASRSKIVCLQAVCRGYLARQR